jgi:hypothetical protein
MNQPVRETNKVSGTVQRIYTDSDGAFIMLKDPEAEPMDGYFRLDRRSHANYNALYSLALAAAINGYTLQIRTAHNISGFSHADVLYMMVDWP